MPVLTFIDTVGIQDFIFVSNRLQDVVGGSELVARATGDQDEGWIREYLPPGGQLIVGAGGNIMARFTHPDSNRAKEDAHAFVGQLSRRMHDDAFGLSMAVAHCEYTDGQLAGAISEVNDQVRNRKFQRHSSIPLMGLGVNASCNETRWPANVLDKKGRPISAALKQRRDVADRAQEQQSKFPDQDFHRGVGPGMKLQYPRDTDKMGRSRGDTSLVGIVHIDGNGIGKKIMEWQKGRQVTSDDALVAEWQSISRGLLSAVQAAWRSILERVVAAIEFDPEGECYQVQGSHSDTGFDLYTDGEDALFLPIRHIILGGDDLTFICDGRIALALAAHGLAQFAGQQVPHIAGPLTACAGIALVKPHSPLIRSYSLAEELCQSAKKMVQRSGSSEASALDWQVAMSSPTEGLARTRERQYGKEFTCRPYLFAADARTCGSWQWLAEEVLGEGPAGFHGPYWRERRSKIKSLRQLVRQGRDSVGHALESWQIVESNLQMASGMVNGYLDGRTPLLDAIEILDIYQPLSKEGI